ncbi:MAG: fluoride efflux transporter CrcB [Gammaproteobacteria bacterium]
MINILIVGIGGFIGSVFRYLLNIWIYNLQDYPVFPFGTMAVNLIGCFVIGILAGLAEYSEAFTPELRLFLFIGVLGGFTTFSSYGYDTFNLLRNGQILFAILNVTVQTFIGLGAVWLGYVCSRIL